MNCKQEEHGCQTRNWIASRNYISVLYGRLDDLRERAGGRMAGVLRQAGGTHQARVERETFSAMYRQQLAQFDAAENGLCFGRLEFSDGELRYIGGSEFTPTLMITSSC